MEIGKKKGEYFVVGEIFQLLTCTRNLRFVFYIFEFIYMLFISILSLFNRERRKKRGARGGRRGEDQRKTKTQDLFGAKNFQQLLKSNKDTYIYIDERKEGGGRERERRGGGGDLYWV